jgi:predicted acyltransferase
MQAGSHESEACFFNVATMQQERYQHLDALRGYAIFTMVLSGTIAHGGVLPGWMYHAQVPPPLHQFNPELPGITWVDLVFPFFIFCMGAAMPIALRKFSATSNHLAVISTAVRRFFLLALFALALEQFKFARISSNPVTSTFLLSIGGFVLLMLSFSKWPSLSKRNESIVNYVAIAAILLALWLLPLNDGAGFLLAKSDIIILVLANMALFGTLLWWFTRKNPLLRIGVLPFVMAVFLAAKIPGTWNEWLFQLTPEPLLYKFYFLKYLFILVPGTIAGEWLLQYGDLQPKQVVQTKPMFSIILMMALIVLNVGLLYTRALTWNLLASVVMIVLMHYLLQKQQSQYPLLYRLMQAGAYCLLLGLAFEAYEGGIKKDVSTYSYYFVTSGLAFFAYAVIAMMSSWSITASIHRFFLWCGKNPMMAYVTGGLLLGPVLKLTGLYDYWAAMNTNAWVGFLKGFLFTIIACGITIPFTKKGMIWKS